MRLNSCVPGARVFDVIVDARLFLLSLCLEFPGEFARELGTICSPLDLQDRLFSRRRRKEEKGNQALDLTTRHKEKKAQVMHVSRIRDSKPPFDGKRSLCL